MLAIYGQWLHAPIMNGWQRVDQKDRFIQKTIVKFPKRYLG